MSNRKVLVISRHAQTRPDPNGKSSDSLANVPEIYNGFGNRLGEVISEREIKLADSFLWHSDLKRTENTAKAAIAGAYRLVLPNGETPQTSEVLDQINYQGLTTRVHPFLCASDLPLSGGLYKKEGEAGMLNTMLTNPKQTEFYGEPSISFGLLTRQSTRAYQDALLKLIYQNPGKKDLAFLATHAIIAEALAGAIVRNSDDLIQSFDQIGGVFGKGEYATVTFDESSTGGWTGEYRKGDFTTPLKISG